MELQFDILLDDQVLFVQHIGIALESRELDSRHVAGVGEEPGELLSVHQLATVRVGPVQTLLADMFDHAQRIAGAGEFRLVIGRGQSPDTGRFGRSSLEPTRTGIRFGEGDRVVVQGDAVAGERDGAAVPVGCVAPGVLGLDQNSERFSRRQFRGHNHDQFHRFASDDFEYRRIGDHFDLVRSALLDGDSKDPAVFAEGLRP